MSTLFFFFFFSSRRRHTRSKRDWSSDVCSSDLALGLLDRLGVAAAETVKEPESGVTFWAPDGWTSLTEAKPQFLALRSEERRVGKEWRARWARGQYKKKKVVEE